MARLFAKLTPAQVVIVRKRHAAGELQRVIAQDFGVSRQAISKVVTGTRWKDI
jgi:hypothetical protein